MWKYKSRSLGDKLDHSLTKESLQLLLLPFYGSDVDARPNEKLWETAMASIFAMQLLSLLQAVENWRSLQKFALTLRGVIKETEG